MALAVADVQWLLIENNGNVDLTLELGNSFFYILILLFILFYSTLSLCFFILFTLWCLGNLEISHLCLFQESLMLKIEEDPRIECNLFLVDWKVISRNLD